MVKQKIDGYLRVCVQCRVDQISDIQTMRELFDGVRDKVAGVCEYCAGAFGVKEAVRAAGLPLIGEFDGHPSLARRISEGRQVVTF